MQKFELLEKILNEHICTEEKKGTWALLNNIIIILITADLGFKDNTTPKNKQTKKKQNRTLKSEIKFPAVHK